jgi:Ca2+-transporting ATPase
MTGVSDTLSRWHHMAVDAVLARLHTSMQGLTAAEAQHRLGTYGPNVLTQAGRRSALGMFLLQFKDFMVLVLMVAAAISGLIGEVGDTIAIIAILVLNAVIGFVQEYRAERAMEALRAMAAPTATVLRDGNTLVIPAAEVVPGDVVLLEAGGIVPADLRLIESAHLRVEEAALTGESVPVEKSTHPLDDADLPLGDRSNMVYKGTVVTYGRGRGVVVATGMTTDFGRIAALLQGTEAVPTPLQRRLAHLGRRLAVVALIICAVILGVGILHGESPMFMFLTAVSLAVAAIPEALPAVVTISLALGARAMIRKKALIRKLPAVETLGSVTYICTDKTGTLTLNQMQLEAWYCQGTVTPHAETDGPWRDLLRAMALCSDTRLEADGKIVGDPTEVALARAAQEVGFAKESLEKTWPRVAEIPFDAERRRMTTLHRHPDGGVVAYTKGAMEALLEHTVSVATASGVSDVNPDEIVAVADRMAADGHRVLALGMRHWPELPDDITTTEVERDLMLLGLVGLLDPPREEAREAVAMCQAAGIVPVMITGDHPLTARAIAKRLGMLSDDKATMTGTELSALSPEDLQRQVEHVRVYARVAPEQKLNIVTALQRRGHIVAMTGDGVNDAPALRRADIGVAMGITGTDVAKEASAMVLLDDNFATIVRAIREGRRIYDNIRRFIKYSITTNSGEVWTMFLAPLLGLPIPLLPIQILWINLVTDGLPGLALAAEPEEADIMSRPPRPPQESVFAHGLALHVLWVGPLMAALTLGTQAWVLHTGSSHWQTMVFTVLCLAQLAHVLAIRSERASLDRLGLFSNTALLGAVALTFGLQMATIYVPTLNRVFKTVSLSPAELATAVGTSSVVFVAVEGEKWLKRKRSRGHDEAR